MENSKGEGRLRVSVTTANGTIPVRGAVVTVYEYDEEDNGEIIDSLRTDRGGLTETVVLPVRNSEGGMTPGGAVPYSLYNIMVSYDGYYPVELVAVPIFGGIVSVQPVDLTPLSEEDVVIGDSGRVMIYETPENESLRPGGSTREDIGDQNGAISGDIIGMRRQDNE